MGNGKTLLVMAWIAAVIGIVTLSLNMSSETTLFYGIAEDQEQIISFQHPVEIIKVHKLEGEAAEEGETILQVRRGNLSSEQAIIEHQIDELNARDKELYALTKAEIKSLESKKQAEIAALNSQIREGESEYKLNLDLLRQLSGTNTRDNKELTANSPILAKLKSLRQMRRHTAKSIQAQIDILNEKLHKLESPTVAQLAELNERKEELSRQQTDLTVQAQFNSRIGSVHFKPGDRIPPFVPVISLHNLSPSFIKGYIHEDVHNKVQLDQKVWIRPNTGAKDMLVSGIVESLGARIVEYPERIKKNVLIPAWGREVIVSLRSKNNLLLGEKVVVTLEKPKPIRHVFSNSIEKISTIFNSTISTTVASETRKETHPKTEKLSKDGS